MAADYYVFTGPEIGERNAAIEVVRQQSEKKYGQLDTHSFYAGDISVGSLMSVVQNGSLFAAACFVVLKNAELLKKKDDIAQITDWAKSSDSSSVLILVSDEIGIDKNLEAAAAKENKKIFWELFEDKKEQWIQNFFRKEGFRIENEAVAAILELVENNTDALRRECSRLLLCNKELPITQDIVEDVLSHNREESPFTLFDVLSDSSRDYPSRLESALEILQKLRLSKESSGVQLIAGLTFCFRKLKIWQDLHSVGFPSDFDLKIKGFSSKKAQDQYRRGAKTWDTQTVAQILALLAQTDLDIRSGGSAVEDTLLQTLLYRIVLRKGLSLTWSAEAV